VTGKPSGADVVRRKWSFPIVWALGRPSSPDREIVARAYASTTGVEQRNVSNVIAALERLGAREAADEAYQAALLEARGIAEGANIDTSGTVREFFREGARRVA
jgi:geranylgeranyl diphosphate synthase, type I